MYSSGFFLYQIFLTRNIWMFRVFQEEKIGEDENKMQNRDELLSKSVWGITRAFVLPVLTHPHCEWSFIIVYQQQSMFGEIILQQCCLHNNFLAGENAHVTIMWKVLFWSHRFL